MALGRTVSDQSSGLREGRQETFCETDGELLRWANEYLTTQTQLSLG